MREPFPPGWSVNTVSGVSWQVTSGADPCGQFDGNRTGGSGPYAILNSGCFSVFTTDDSSLVTPPMDLSGKSTAAIQWANDFVDFDSGTVASVDVSIDGGASWANVWTAPRPDLPGPGDPLADMTMGAGHANVQARFHYQGFWAWWWQVDDVEVGAFACTPLPGGLVVGNVTDANTGLGLNGATVGNTASGDPVTTFATPEDPAQGDGLYILFSESGCAVLRGGLPGARTLDEEQDRHSELRDAPGLRAQRRLPRSGSAALSLSMSPGGSQSLALTVTNTGTASGSFVIKELNVPTPPPAPARPATRRPAPRTARRRSSGSRSDG